MKILLIFFSLFYALLPSQSRQVLLASTPRYARALSSIELYKLSTDTNDVVDIFCMIEKSYFVEIISENSMDYKVNYNGITGFVKKNDVQLVSNIPNTPFPNNIKITIGNSCNMRLTPSTKTTTNNVITVLPEGTSDIIFLGRIFAEESIDFGGTTWYYVNYNGERGYIYNKYVKAISPIYENTEVSTPYQIEQFQSINPIGNTSSIIIMILLFIPCIAILIILYLPNNKFKIKQPKSKYDIEKY